MTYLSRFSLSRDPFAVESVPEDVVTLAPQTALCRALSEARAEPARISIVFGAPGRGASTAAALCQSAAPEEVAVAHSDLRRPDALALWQAVLEALGLGRLDGDVAELESILLTFLRHHARQARHPWLLLDGVHTYTPSAFEALQRVATTNDGPLAKWVLIGHPSLARPLRSKPLATLAARCAPPLTLEALAAADTETYVFERLARAGVRRLLFTPAAIDHIHRESLGTVAHVARLARAALERAAALDRMRVDEDVVEDVLTRTTLSAPEPASPPAAGEPWLQWSGRDGGTQRYVLPSGRTLAGRGAHCELRLASPFASRYHALLIRDGDDVSIADLNSENGVFVNGRRVAARRLADGDVVALGRYQFRFRAPTARPSGDPDVAEPDTSRLPAIRVPRNRGARVGGVVAQREAAASKA